MQALKEYDGEDAVILFDELVREKDALKTPQRFDIAFMPSFSKASEGLRAGDFIVIGGASGEGKSLLLHTLIDDLYFQSEKHHSLVLSFEQTPELMAEKYADRNGDIKSVFYIPRNHNWGAKYDEEIEALKANANTYIGSLPSRQLQWLYLKLLECRAKGYKVKAVFVDYLHQLVDTTRRSRDPVGDVVQALQRMIHMFNVMLFVVCHFTKEATDKSDEREPANADLRDSGWIINAADVIWLIWRLKSEDKQSYTRQSIIKVGKHRRKGDILRGRKYIMEKIDEYLIEVYQQRKQEEEKPGELSFMHDEDRRFG